MPGEEELDTCPFCNAPWGECMHVKLLLEWETDALVREAQHELGSTAAADHQPQPDSRQPPADDLSARSQGR